MKLKFSLILASILLFPLISYASSVEGERDEKVITYKITSLDDEIMQVTKGRTYFPPGRAIIKSEALVLKRILTEGKFPQEFSWHHGTMVSDIIGVIGEIPYNFYQDENPTGRLFNYSVPALHRHNLENDHIPEFDMVLRYQFYTQTEYDFRSSNYHFALTLANTRHVEPQEEDTSFWGAADDYLINFNFLPHCTFL